MNKEHRKIDIKRVKSRRFQEPKRIPFPVTNEGWVEVLEGRKVNVLRRIRGQSSMDRRIDDRRTIERRLDKKHIQDKPILIKEEIDYIFKLLS